MAATPQRGEHSLPGKLSGDLMREHGASLAASVAATASLGKARRPIQISNQHRHVYPSLPISRFFFKKLYSCGCTSSEHFGRFARRFMRASGSSGLEVQAAIAC